MQQKLKGWDLARGFTVLWMPVVHTVMIFGKPAVAGTWPGYFLRFIAEGPGAQLFMMVMGAGVVLGRKRTAGEVLQRSLSLFGMGILLNLLRLVLPLWCGFIPAALLVPYMGWPNWPVWLNLLGTGDILAFAGISYLLVQALFRLGIKARLLAGFSIFFLLPFSTAATSHLHSGNAVFDYLFSLLSGNHTAVYFPVLYWLPYPVAGLLYAAIYREFSFPGPRRTIMVSLILLGGGFLLHFLQGAASDFYHPSAGNIFLHTGFVLLWLQLFEKLANWPAPGLLTNLLAFCSRHITSIYMVQWILIGWCLGLWPWQQMAGLALTAPVVFVESVTLAAAIVLSASERARINRFFHPKIKLYESV